MATSAVQSFSDERHTLSVVRLLITGAVSAAVIFVLCWLGTFLPISSPTHSLIGLATSAEMSSGRALVEGAAWSFVFGGLVATTFALVYNLSGAVVRR